MKPSTGTDEEFTELVDAHIPRVDLVGAAANGHTRFLIAKNAGGLVDPALVRELIGKAAPEPEPVAVVDRADDTVTLTGSPGAIAKMIHQAAMAKAERSTKSTNDLPDDAFAYIEPGGTKDDEGKTTPRSLRHFPIDDEAHVRNALSRAPQSPFGDKAMPKIRAAAKKLGIEVAKTEKVAKDMELDESTDGMDPTVILAAPDDEDAPGDPNDPGSPAWEAIDAATARKWTAILSRAKTALGVMSDREMLEAAAGDCDDAEQAMDLDDAGCAIDYAISVLAPFAVDEQAEADCTSDMAAVGKALASFDTAPLDVIEALDYVAKAGRTLSAANEQAIRGAVESLQKVLTSLPAPEPKESGQSVAKTEETPMPHTEPATEAEAEAGETPTMDTPDVVGKATSGEKAPQVAVYDAKGKLVGIADPADITPISGADTDGGGEEVVPDTDGDATPDGAQTDTPDPADLTPAPAAEAGTPADAVPDDVTKTTTPNTTIPTTDTPSDAVFKSIAADVVKAELADYSATQEQVIAKQAADMAQMADVVETLKGQVKALEEQPATPKVFTNGAVPPAHQMRGQDHGTIPADTARAHELKKQLYDGGAADAPEQNRAANELQEMAIAKLRDIQRR